MSEELIVNQNPKIIGIITNENVDKLFKDTSFIPSLKICDVLEFRADTFPENSIGNLLPKIRDEISRTTNQDKILLFTIRLKVDGGKWKKDPSSRHQIFNRVINQKLADWIDIEIEEAASAIRELSGIINKAGLKLLISHHNYKTGYTTDEFKNIAGKMAGFHPDIAKIVVTAQSKSHLHSLLQFSPSLTKQFPLSCLISMGKFGPLSRILSPFIGAPLTYGYFGNKSVVPGQIEVSELKHYLNKLYETQAEKYNIKEMINFVEQNLHEYQIS